MTGTVHGKMIGLWRGNVPQAWFRVHCLLDSSLQEIDLVNCVVEGVSVSRVAIQLVLKAVPGGLLAHFASLS